MSNYSKACCSIPPVISSGYETKGKYITLNGMKTYVTGPESAQEAILVVYDIFGFFPQTLQGADIVSTSDPDRKYRVFMPDFFDGSPANISWYPPQTEEHQQNLSQFFQTRAPPPNTLPRIPGVLEEANKLAPGGAGFKSWGMMGYCWGGKITSLAAGRDSLFRAAVQCHPAMVDPKDAESVTIPMALLASMDEEVDVIEQYKKNLKVPNLVQTWPTQIHGWMAARGDLANPEVKKEYENGYKTVLAFFHEHMPGTTSKI
ncbi:dienelactone hydrolase [Coccidioides immitis RS]|uniref:Dienelactone hydrolase n=2 Tax=Coccidioides immitis (strain RS) TaxID=246410 RepID=A0A0D8JWD0_COCIM|nr:dienelactone hydrolase [Coccidioides immitis RS]KJF61236.1 dienelactone hydrolase [Coccidioides immitis RS]